MPCQVYEPLHCCMLWHCIWHSSALLRALSLWAVFHSSETPYDLGCRDTRQMVMSTHISIFWQNHFNSFLTYIILFWMVSAIFKHTNDKTYHKILSKNVFNPGLNVYIFRCKLHLLQGVWTNPHSQKACMVSLELFRISTSFPTVGGGDGGGHNMSIYLIFDHWKLQITDLFSGGDGGKYHYHIHVCR